MSSTVVQRDEELTVQPAPRVKERVAGTRYLWKDNVRLWTHKGRWNSLNTKCVCGKTQPRFALTFGQKPVWCSKCPEKPLPAVNVVHRRCACGKASPVFGLEGDSRPTWCMSCSDKPVEAFNIVGTKCRCGKHKPSFGMVDDMPPIWCSLCPDKPDYAIDVYSKTCECGSAYPIFGLQSEMKRTWCAKCPGRPSDAVDVKHARCACGLARPTFGAELGSPALWCAQCPDKPTTATDVMNSKCPCGHVPLFGLTSDCKPLWCSICPAKPDIARDVVSRRCELCKLTTVGKYKPYCAPCFYHKHPDMTAPKAYRTREAHLFRQVLTDFPNVFRYDVPIDGGCSGRKPDLFADLLTHTVHGENDEHMHSNVQCENKRMMQLFLDTGCRPQVVIRFNPDKYVDASGIPQVSCFYLDADKKLCVDEERWQDRYQMFKSRLEYWLQNIPTKEVTTEYLFYDGY